MDITSIEKFVDYLEQTRRITQRVIKVIPPDKINWTYLSGKFTIADLIRHIACIERYVFMEVIQGNKPTYKGCRKDLVDGYPNILEYFDELHRQSIEILLAMKDEDLQKEVSTLDGKVTTVVNFLRALIVHEVHHRGVLYIYLNLIGVSTPPVLGLMEQEVIEVCK